MGRTSLRIILSDVGERRLGPKRRRLTRVLVPDQFSSPKSRSGGHGGLPSRTRDRETGLKTGFPELKQGDFGPKKVAKQGDFGPK